MRDYRAYVVGPDGRISTFEAFRAVVLTGAGAFFSGGFDRSFIGNVRNQGQALSAQFFHFLDHRRQPVCIAGQQTDPAPAPRKRLRGGPTDAGGSTGDHDRERRRLQVRRDDLLQG